MTIDVRQILRGLSCSAVVAAAVLAMPAAGGAQAPAAPGTGVPQVERYRTTGARIAIGRSVHVERDEEVLDAVVVVGGSVRVDGRVRDGLVVVGGNVVLGPESDVRGDVVLIGGQLTREPGARLTGSLSDVTFADWIPHWTFGGLWGPWTPADGFWGWVLLVGTFSRIVFLIVVAAAMMIVARGPAQRVGHAVGAEPLRSAVAGVAAAILFLPALIVACAALAVTIIGIPFIALIVPVALGLAVAALLLGLTGIAWRVGAWLGARLGSPGDRPLSAVVLGLLLITAPTMVSRLLAVAPGALAPMIPAWRVAGVVVELVAWTIGLGAVVLTGFGRWHLRPPPLTPGG